MVVEEQKIKGGCVLIARKLIESEIWSKPPLYIKVWLYLLSKAQHADYKLLKRGQLRTSTPEIIENCGWYVGYRKVRPTKDQIYQIISWLRRPCEGSNEGYTKATMITTTKATQGILITIDNYSVYQDLKSYESNDESNNEKATRATREQRLPNNINKNVNNVNNDNIKDVPPPPYEKIKEFYNEICVSMPKIKVLNDDRKKAIKARWNRYNSLDIFIDVFKRAEQSNFLKGSNPKNWHADFDWLLTDKYFTRTQEGKYGNVEKAKVAVLQPKEKHKPDKYNEIYMS